MKLPSDFNLLKYGINVRLVEEKDAEFITNIRLDSDLNEYLKRIPSDVESQKDWINQYKVREAQGLEYYFIYFVEGEAIGVNRMTNIGSDSWMGASVIFKKDSPPGAAILATLLHYYIGFEFLGKSVHFGEYKRNNTRAKRFNDFFGSELVHEDGENVYIILTKKMYLLNRSNVEKLLRIFN